MALFPAVGRKQFHVRFSWWLVIFVLCLGIFLHLVPFYFMLITSLKSGLETLQNPPTFWPQQPTFVAWQNAFMTLNHSMSGAGSDVPFVTYFWNSLVMAGGTVLLSTPITCFAAYANSKLQRGPVARWTFLFCIGTIFLPGVLTLVPNYLMIAHFPYPLTYVPKLPDGSRLPTLSMLDSPLAIIIPAAFNAGGFLYFKAYFDTIPNSILQAARVDGGSEFNIFRRIVLPMSIPVFAIVVTAQFTGTWDGFLWPSLVITSPEKEPLTVAIYTLINSFMNNGAADPAQAAQAGSIANKLAHMGLTWSGLMVLGILQSIPTFICFALSFRYLLRGIRIRGLR